MCYFIHYFIIYYLTNLQPRVSHQLSIHSYNILSSPLTAAPPVTFLHHPTFPHSASQRWEAADLLHRVLPHHPAQGRGAHLWSRSPSQHYRDADHLCSSRTVHLPLVALLCPLHSSLLLPAEEQAAGGGGSGWKSVWLPWVRLLRCVFDTE